MPLHGARAGVQDDGSLVQQSRRVLVLGALLLVLLNSAWFSATAVVPQVHGIWHLTAATSAWLTIAVQWGFGVGAVGSAIFVVSDIFSVPGIIFVSSLGVAISNAALLVAHNAPTAIFERFLTGFFIAGIYPPWLKLIATWYKRSRGMAIGVLVGALNVGEGLPYLVNAIGGLNWRIVIVTSSLASAGGGVLTRWAITEGPYQAASAKFDVHQAGRAFRNTFVRLAGFGYICHMWELYAGLTWFPVFAAAVFAAHGSGNETSALVVTFAVFLAGACATWTGGLIGDRIGREITAIAMMAVSAACCLLIGLTFRLPLFLLVVFAVIWGYSIIGDSVQFSALVTENSDPSYVGSALTLQMAFGFFLSGFTIWLIPAVHTLVGWEWTFAVLAPGPALGILMMLRSLRKKGEMLAQVGLD